MSALAPLLGHSGHQSRPVQGPNLMSTRPKRILKLEPVPRSAN
jgi:hypothetical protein